MKLFKTIGLCTMAVVMSACTSAHYRETVDSVNQTEADINQQAAALGNAPAVVTHQGFYVDASRVPLSAAPAWLSAPVNMTAHQLPLSVLMAQLLKGANVGVSFNHAARGDRVVSLQYQGTVVGALDRLALKTGYYYRIDHGTVVWSNLQTKTFNISFMPGTSTYLVGQSKQQGGNSQQSDSGSGASNSIGQVNDSQYSNLEASLSVWSDLESTLEKLKSKEGRVVVSQATTTVTVIDRPENVAAMGRYITALNKTLSLQVAVKVRVLDVQLNDSFNFGINWSLVQQVMNTQLQFSGGMGKVTDLAAGSLVRSGDSSTALFQIGGNNTNAVIQALSKQGKVSTVTEPQVVTLNNQIASIRITKNTGYIKSVSSTSNQSTSTNAIVPGNITSGFTLYVLPKVKGNKVYMQISSTIANLVKLEKVDNVPTSVTSTSGDTPSYQAIEVPTLAEKQFNQRSVVESGTTLVVAGYQSLDDQLSHAKLFGVAALGGKGSESEHDQTVLLITPVILGADHS